MTLRLAAAVVLLTTLLAGCDDGSSSIPTPTTSPRPSTATAGPSTATAGPSEAAVGRGQACPDALPRDDTPHGFGTDEAATSLPTLAAPKFAWVCSYRASQLGRGPEGSVFRWVRTGTVEVLPAAKVAALGAGLLELTLPPTARFCTADLGPRVVLVLQRDGNLVGVVFDQYGCGDVRLTGDVFRTPPGEGSANGTVPGVLEASSALYRLVAANATR